MSSEWKKDFADSRVQRCAKLIELQRDSRHNQGSVQCVDILEFDCFEFTGLSMQGNGSVLAVRSIR